MQVNRRWLFGPWPDLALGCGLAYAVVFLVMAVAGGTLRDALPLGLALLPINLISSAHYGATAVRAYERAEDRRQHVVHTLGTTLLLGACFVAGLSSVTAGSWLITVYLTWSPWHYALQNYGVAMTFLRRRGVAVSPGARRALHLSFVTSFALAALALHAAPPQASYAPNQLESGVYSFIPLGPLAGVPDGAAGALLAAAGAAWLASTIAAVVLLRRGGTLRDLVPALVLVGTQALWFSVPVLARANGVLQDVEPLSTEHAAYAFLWIGAGHAAQYLWITAYYAKRAGASRSNLVFTLKSLLAGTALWYVPALLFAPGILGRLPYDAGLAAMVAALVNLHHFVLDGAIWKLRDTRVAGVLVEGGAAGGAPAPARASPALRVALWTGGAAVLAATVATLWVVEFGFNRPIRRGDLETARRAADTLDALGQPSAEARLQLGDAYMDAGRPDLARSAFERSLAVQPTAWAHVKLGDLATRESDWRAAAAHYRRALEIEPDHATATFLDAAVAIELGETDRGRRGLLRARDLAARDVSAPAGLLRDIELTLGDARLAPPSPGDPFAYPAGPEGVSR